VLCTLALWLVVGWSGMTAWWAELLRFVPYPAYLAPALLSAAASWWLRWPWRLAALAGVLIVLVGVMDLQWGGPDRGSGQFRVLTLNAKAQVRDRTGERDQRIAAELLAHDADVVVLQDADDYARPGVPLPATVAAALSDRTLFSHGQHVVASRVPMHDCRAQPVAAGPVAGDFVRCTLRVAGVDVDLVTVHLLSPRVGLNAARREWLDDGLDEWEQNYRTRLAQAEGLLRHLAGAPRPLVLAGDFNASEASPVVRSLKSGLGLRDAFASAGRGYGHTHGHSLRPRFSFLRIDHILVSRELGVRDCFVGGRDASDHRPVIADLLVARH
jgi:endonuclease/exonuclease/phosphatase (EEP) superfamily protein YafD